jgi:hypothetical protein
MARAHKTRREPEGIHIGKEEPLIAVPDDAEGETYFTSEEAADAARTDETLQQALETAGAFSDLSWEEAEADFARMRHEDRSSSHTK